MQSRLVRNEPLVECSLQLKHQRNYVVKSILFECCIYIRSVLNWHTSDTKGGMRGQRAGFYVVVQEVGEATFLKWRLGGALVKRLLEKTIRSIGNKS